MTKKNKKKDYASKYSIIKEIGKGGNAKVYECTMLNDTKEIALKDLINRSDEKKARFIDEINIMTDNCDLIDGIIPIFDFSKENFWYTMPIATLIIDHIKNQHEDIVQIVEGVIQLTNTLSLLHNKGISHRDIKPSNIYFYKDRYCLGDFGLVDLPDNPNDFTRSDKGLGAIFTIAPEMKRNPKEADGRKADVFSLAKTLWMLLTLDEKGFDGVYNFLDTNYSLRFIDKYKNIHLVEIEELLYQATLNNPNDRPTIDNFKLQLESWIKIYNDGYLSQLSDWKFLNKYLFKENSPDSTSWRNIDGIIHILNIIGNIPAYNHMFFSDRGGLDFERASKAKEKDCIYVYSGGCCNVVKPKRLYFEGFNDFEWNYFLLELDELEPILGETTISSEFVVEDYPGHYVSAQYAQYGVYDYDKGNKLPKGFKLVERYLRGKFLIVLKRGPYNSIRATYDGRHGDCSNTDFREYLEWIIKSIETDKKKGYNQEEILQSPIFNENPFKQKNNIDDTKSEKTAKMYPDKYINENYKDWCFNEIINKFVEQQSGNIKFYFEFKGVGSSLSFLKDNGLYLSTDGYIKSLRHDDTNKILYINKREDAIKIQNLLNERIKNLCESYNVESLSFDYYFSICLAKEGKPTHLFTKEEIKDLMEKADDRTNNKLVIDENGYAKLIQSHLDGNLYPVSHETWCAGKVYVGKYSNLNDLEDSYLSSLEGWLHYLETGQRIYKDRVNYNANIDDLIEKIKKFY